MSAQGLLPESHQAWSTEEGLPDASVHAVVQTHDGYLWLATERGVARFDGSSFKVFQHDNTPAFASDDVSSMAEDAAGRLWFGTGEGLVVEKNGAFRRPASLPAALAKANVLQLAVTQDGPLLVLTADAVWRVDGEKVVPVPPFVAPVRALSTSRDGAVRLFLANGLVERFSGGEFRPEPRQFDGQEHVVAEQDAPNGARWVQTTDGLTVVQAAPSQRFSPLHGAGQASARVTAMLPEPGGGGWIGTNHGLFAWSGKAGEPATPVEALRGEPVLTLAADREGDLWVGTEGAGLHVLRPRAFRSEGAAAGEAVTCVVSDGDGGFWFGTREAGVEHVLRSGRTKAISPDAMTSPRVLSLVRGAQGDLWVGTPDGLNHLVGDRVIQTWTSADGLPDDFVRSLAPDAQGTLWIGTRRGLVSLDRHGKMAIWTVREGLPSDSIGPLLPGAPGTEELWVGTSHGLALLRHGRVLPLLPAAGLQRAIVTALSADGAGGLWLGVHGQGLAHWSGAHLQFARFPNVPSEVTALLTDGRGFLWMRGPQQVVRAPGQGLLQCLGAAAPCTSLMDRLSAADGMPSDELAAEGTPQIATGHDGELWFSTRRGIAVADPSQLPMSHVAPPVVVQRLTVDGVGIENTGGDLRLGPGHSRFVVDYAALSFRLPSKVRYRYRLDGFDRDWVDAGTARTAYYTALPARTYRFRVLAEAGDGLWSRQEATLTFRILPPFYRRWWFFLLVIASALALALAILRLRERGLQRRFALVLDERNRMAREIHDTLAQDFVSVSLQLDIATGHLRGERYRQATEQLQATRAQVKEGLRAARQSIWNLRANAGEDSLPARLSALAARFTFDRPPQVAINGAFRKLPPSLEDEVLRVAGEALSNAHRHAEAHEVSLTLRYDPELLTLKVRDDGQGFHPEDAVKAEGHYGVRGLYERAAALHAELRMESSPGQGTTVLLQVPLRGKEVGRS